MLTNYCIDNKIIQKYINDYFYTLSEEEFCLDIAILDALHFHN